MLAWPSGQSFGLAKSSRLLISKNVVVDFDPIHGNSYTLAEALEALV